MESGPINETISKERAGERERENKNKVETNETTPNCVWRHCAVVGSGAPSHELAACDCRCSGGGPTHTRLSPSTAAAFGLLLPATFCCAGSRAADAAAAAAAAGHLGALLGLRLAGYLGGALVAAGYLGALLGLALLPPTWMPCWALRCCCWLPRALLGPHSLTHSVTHSLTHSLK